MNRNLSWAMKNKKVKSRREALEKQKIQVKLDTIRHKKTRIRAFSYASHVLALKLAFEGYQNAEITSSFW